MSECPKDIDQSLVDIEMIDAILAKAMGKHEKINKDIE